MSVGIVDLLLPHPSALRPRTVLSFGLYRKCRKDFPPFFFFSFGSIELELTRLLLSRSWSKLAAATAISPVGSPLLVIESKEDYFLSLDKKIEEKYLTCLFLFCKEQINTHTLMLCVHTANE